MVLIRDEMVHMVKGPVAGILFNDETWPLVVICRVDLGGHFLSYHHTARLFREEPQPIKIHKKRRKGSLLHLA